MLPTTDRALPAGPLRFDGAEYVRSLDDVRLTGQIRRVFELMRDGHWRTLDEIGHATGDPVASISAQLRHLRRPRFGRFQVEKRHRGEPCRGLWEYAVRAPLPLRQTLLEFDHASQNLD